MDEKLNPDGTVGKALAVLELISDYNRPVRFSELLDRSRHPKATLYRLVQTLTNQNMLEYNKENGTYAPGMRLVKLAHSAWRQSSLAPIARNTMDKLAATLRETLHLAQMDEGQVLYIDKRNAARPIDMFSAAGKTGPGYCTGVGKVILAFQSPEIQNRALEKQSYDPYTQNTITSRETLKQELQRIAQAGFAFDREEHEHGIICIAVPIITKKQRVLGALSLTSSTQRHSLSSLEKNKVSLLKAADEISTAAASWQFPT